MECKYSVNQCALGTACFRTSKDECEEYEPYIEEKETLKEFFIFFRNNGEKYIGLSVEKLIDVFYENRQKS